MMHHPNMHHQAMSGHPPQHMPAHQGMPGHHQMPPHQMHRENRHVTLTRVPLGPSQPGGGMGGHGPAMGGMGATMGVPPPHHGPAQRPPHPIRPMPHHPQAPHHSVPPQQMKPMRRPYIGGGYGSGPGVMPPHYAPQPRQPQPPSQPPAVVPTVSTTVITNVCPSGPEAPAGDGKPDPAPAADKAADERAAPGDSEAARPAPPNSANSKEKTPMCLVNELARYNKIKHQYRLTSETGPAHKKVFTVTLRLGDTEEYTAEGSSIKRAQHAAASAALGATAFPPPPPRAHPPHAAPHAHHRHAGAVMPTVELNALAMKLCQPAVYTSIPPVAAPARGRGRAPAPYRYTLGAGAPLGGPHHGGAPLGGPLHAPHHAHAHASAAALLYRVRVSVGGRAWLGEGATPQAARHDAAARALHDLRPPPPAPGAPAATAGPAAIANGTASAPLNATASPQQTDSENGETNGDALNSEVKSPVSFVHELALKRNLSVQFSVKSERGPPHMRVFVTACTVGDIETEGEGNGKKVSKRRAAEHMLEEMRRRWPPAVLRARAAHDKRRHQPAKKKPRNLIKEGGAAACGGCAGADNPISRLAAARQGARARSPQYRVLEERGQARRREFLVQCDAPPHCATGLGPNKKEAKRRAAHNVLLAMDMGSVDSAPDSPAPSTPAADLDSPDTKRKESDSAASVGGAAGSEVRQPVPGVLMMDYHQRSSQPPQPNGISETSATGGGGSTPGAKDQLMYLSQLLGFTVQFSDFPKRNHGEYLSLVSLSTEPPVMCHGGGPSTAHSHEQCSRTALRALALMGLDAPSPAAATSPTAADCSGVSAAPPTASAAVTSVPVASAGVVTNGVAE